MENYGVRGEDIHKWIDEFSKFMGQLHRKYRHSPHKLLNNSSYLPKKFKDKYGPDLAINIAWDHYVADDLIKNIDSLQLPLPDKDLEEKVFLPLGGFIKEKLIKKEGTNILIHDAYVAYYEYCKQKNIIRCSRQRFTHTIRKYFHNEFLSSIRKMCLVNVQLIEDAL